MRPRAGLLASVEDVIALLRKSRLTLEQLVNRIGVSRVSIGHYFRTIRGRADLVLEYDPEDRTYSIRAIAPPPVKRACCPTCGAWLLPARPHVCGEGLQL